MTLTSEYYWEDMQGLPLPGYLRIDIPSHTRAYERQGKTKISSGYNDQDVNEVLSQKKLGYTYQEISDYTGLTKNQVRYIIEKANE